MNGNVPRLTVAGRFDPAQAVAPRQVVDLTTRLDASGRLSWDVPEGQWTILRLGYTPNGSHNSPAPREATGLEVDKLSREAMDAYFEEGMMRKVLQLAGPLVGKSFNNALIDSYEVGSQNWTPEFRAEFRKRRGYDLLPWLPTFSGRAVDSPALTDRFLWDLRRTIADLFAENYARRFAELCHQNGLLCSIEPYGNGPFNDLDYGAAPDILMGEFWAGGGVDDSVKLAASLAHTNGRRYVGAESFTASPENGKWLNTPWSLKAIGDQAFCAGRQPPDLSSLRHAALEGRRPRDDHGAVGLSFRSNKHLVGAGAGLDEIPGAVPVPAPARSFRGRCRLLLRRERPRQPPRRQPAAAKGLRVRRLRDQCPRVAHARRGRSDRLARRHDLPRPRPAARRGHVAAAA